MSGIGNVTGFSNSYNRNVNGILAEADVPDKTKIQFSTSKQPLLNIITGPAVGPGPQAGEANGLYADDSNVFVGIEDGDRFSDFNALSDYVTFIGNPVGTAGVKAQWWNDLSVQTIENWLP